MFLLTSTADKMQVITSAAGKVDVHCSYADASGSPAVIALGRQNTPITTATTADIVGAPAAATSRNVKQIKISNNHATVTNTVTLQHTDGANVIQLEQVTLAPGERMGYEEGVGIRVYDVLGREKLAGPNVSASGNSNLSTITCNGVDTYLTGSQVTIGNRLQNGSSFHWTIRATKTAAGVAAPVINVRVGTAATTADAARCVHTGVAQTAVVDTAWFEIEANFQQTGAAAVLNSIVRMDHTAADGAGMGTYRYTQVASASFDVTPVGSIIGLSINPGASGVWSVQFVKIATDALLN